MMMLRSLLAILALGLFAASPALAATAGQVTHLSGTLSAKRADGTSRLLSVKSEVLEGDSLGTEAETYARIKFVDGAEVVMRPGTRIKIDNYSYNETKPQSDNFFLSLFKGGLRAVTGLIGKRSREKVSFHTETATIGIRGTHFGALLCQDDCAGVPTTSGTPPANGLHTDVTNGAIVMSNGAGTVVVNAGQFGFVANAGAAPVVVPPQQGVQVTLPSSITEGKSGGRGIGKGGASDCSI